MQKELSIYLDIVRFSAALAVFFGHASGVTGGFLWQFEALSYKYAGVIIFFVLSGYVIAYVADTKEKLIEDYITARLARLYSVILPALLLTMICTIIAVYFNGPLIKQISDFTFADHVVRFVMTLFNLQYIWTLELTPGLNGPFWSLSFEVFYYCIFAASFYFRGTKRIVLILFFAILAGPTILFLFPMWLMGYFTYKFHQRYDNRLGSSKLAAIVSIIALLLLLVAGPILKNHIGFTIPYIKRWALAGEYFDAITFTLHIMFAQSLVLFFKKVIFFMEVPVRWLASLTFALYLFHVPLLNVLPLLYVEDESAISSRLILYTGTFIIIASFGRWCEKQKYPLKQYIKPKAYKLFKRK